MDDPTESRPGGGGGARAVGPGVGALLALLALAAALRTLRLDSGLWFDEVVTLVDFARLAPADIVTTYTAINNHVGFSLLARLSMDVFGESAWALRLPAVLLGVASIAALWWLGRRVSGPREALLAALLLSVSYHHVWFSQNARGYTGLLLWTLLGTGLFLEGMRRRARGLWVAYAGVMALALYTHLSGVFAFAAHGVAYLFLLGRSRLGRSRGGSYPGGAEAWPLLGFALGGVLTLLLYAPLLPQMIEAFSLQSGEQSANVKIRAWTNPLWTAVEVLRGLRLGFASTAGALAVGGLAAVGWLSAARRDPLLAALVALPVPITLAALLALSFHIWPRYLFVLVGFAALLLVRGACVAAELVVRAAGGGEAAVQRAGTALVALLALASALSLGANFRHPKQDYAGARDYVEARRAPGERVVAVGLAAFVYGRYYAPEWRSAEDLAELEALRAGAPGTWVVWSFPSHLSAAAPDLRERVERDFALERTFPGTVGDGAIYVFHQRDGSPAAGDAQATGSGDRPGGRDPSPARPQRPLTGEADRPRDG